MKNILRLGTVLGFFLFVVHCGSAQTSSDEGGEATAFVTLSSSTDEVDGDVAALVVTCGAEAVAEGLTCITPDDYTVGLLGFELVDCAGDCDDSSGSIANIAATTTVFTTTPAEDFTLTDAGVAIDPAGLPIDAGDYGGIRATLGFLQQALPDDDSVEAAIRGKTYRICTSIDFCGVTGAERGDVLIDSDEDGDFEWIDETGAITDTRPANPVQDDFFAGGDPGGDQFDGDGNFTPSAANDSGEQAVLADATVTINAAFVITTAFRFADDDADGVFEPTAGEPGGPGKPDVISVTITNE